MNQRADVQSILKLRVPVIVRLSHRRMGLGEVMGWGPGALIELPKQADEPLDLMVNNKFIGQGTAVKIGENFGLRVTSVRDPAARVRAMGPDLEQQGATASPMDMAGSFTDTDAPPAAEDE
jgi:flagellar motor switch protein FliN/FliY